MKTPAPRRDERAGGSGWTSRRSGSPTAGASTPGGRCCRAGWRICSAPGRASRAAWTCCAALRRCRGRWRTMCVASWTNCRAWRRRRTSARRSKEFHELAKVGRVGKKAWPDPDVYEPIKTAFENFRDELRGLGTGAVRRDGRGTAGRPWSVGRRLLRVAGEAVDAYRERKRAHGVVDFQDLLTAARDLLRDRAGGARPLAGALPLPAHRRIAGHRPGADGTGRVAVRRAG